MFCVTSILGVLQQAAAALERGIWHRDFHTASIWYFAELTEASKTNGGGMLLLFLVRKHILAKERIGAGTLHPACPLFCELRRWARGELDPQARPPGSCCCGTWALVVPGT